MNEITKETPGSPIAQQNIETQSLLQFRRSRRLTSL
ncbi:unnamed protein product [Brassica napus]|nr:unnamed protein product [Brassica napus]